MLEFRQGLLNSRNQYISDWMPTKTSAMRGERGALPSIRARRDEGVEYGSSASEFEDLDKTEEASNASTDSSKYTETTASDEDVSKVLLHN